MNKLLLILLILIFGSCSCNETIDNSSCNTYDWKTPIENKFQPPKKPVVFNKPFELNPEESRVQFLYVLSNSFMSSYKELGLEPLKKEDDGTYIAQYNFKEEQFTKAWKIDLTGVIDEDKIWFQRILYSKIQDRYFILNGFGEILKFNQYTGKITLVGNIGARKSTGNYIFWANETFYLETDGICHVTTEDGFDKRIAGSIHKVFNVNKEIQDKKEICFPEWGSNRKSNGEKIFFGDTYNESLYIYDPITNKFNLEITLKNILEKKGLVLTGLLSNVTYKNKLYLTLIDKLTDKKEIKYKIPLYEYDFITKELNIVVNKDFSGLLKYLKLDPKKAQWIPHQSKRIGDDIFIHLVIGETLDLFFTSHMLIKYNIKNESCTALYRYVDDNIGALTIYGDYMHITGATFMNINNNSLLLISPIDEEYDPLPIRIE